MNAVLDNTLIDKIKKLLNRELIKRQLIAYFHKKGFEDNFDNPIYPPVIVDMPIVIPELNNKLEIVPFIAETDITNGMVRAGWNLFVLGNKRMYLGDTVHVNLTELQNATVGAPSKYRGFGDEKHSPREIIEFIMRILENSKTGLTLQPPDLPMPQRTPLGGMMARPIGPINVGGYYDRGRR